MPPLPRPAAPRAAGPNPAPASAAPASPAPGLGFGLARLAAADLACVRGGRGVFSRVGFAAAAGTALAVVGPNGAGKTSLLRVLAGLLPASAGRAAFEAEAGHPLAPRLADSAPAELTHLVGHRDGLKDGFTPRETLRGQAALLGRARLDPSQNPLPLDDAIEAALEALGALPLADLRCGVLSAGQRRRVALARAALVPRPVWLLDEPSAALDAAGLERLGAVVSAHLARGGIVLATTHAPLPFPTAATLDLGRPRGDGAAPALGDPALEFFA